MQNRVKVVTQAMKSLTQDENFESAHIFIESDTDDSEPLLSFLAEQHNVFFTLIANFIPVYIDSLPFQKGPRLLKIDSTILGALNAAIKATIETLNETKNDLSKLFELWTLHAEETKTLRGNIEYLKGRLKEIDHNGNIDEVRYLSDTWYFFKYPKHVVTLDAKHANYTHTVIDMSGKRHLRIEKQVVTELDEGKKRITFHTTVKRIWTSLSGKIVVSSKSQDIYRDRILQLKADLKDNELSLKKIEDVQKLQVKHLDIKNKRKTETSVRQKHLIQMRAYLNRNWTNSDYKKMRSFYQEANKIKDSNELVEVFQKAWENKITS